MAVSRAQTPHPCGQPWGRGGARGRSRAQARGRTAPSRSCHLTRASKMPVSIHRTPKARSCAKKSSFSERGRLWPVAREDRAAPAPCGNQWFSGTLDPHSRPCIGWGRAGGGKPMPIAHLPTPGGSEAPMQLPHPLHPSPAQTLAPSPASAMTCACVQSSLRPPGTASLGVQRSLLLHQALH